MYQVFESLFVQLHILIVVRFDILDAVEGYITTHDVFFIAKTKGKNVWSSSLLIIVVNVFIWCDRGKPSGPLRGT